MQSATVIIGYLQAKTAKIKEGKIKKKFRFVCDEE